MNKFNALIERLIDTKPVTKVLKLILPIYLLAGCSDALDASFDDWEAVNASGSIERGWIPYWLPKEATNIQERHNLDTTAIAFSFDMPVSNPKISELTCPKAVNVPKPDIHLKTFPPNIQKLGNIKICDGFYMRRSNRTFYLWKN